MAEYRTMRVTFWNDPYIEELSPFDKLLYIYLFSCPSVNNLGVLEVTRKKIAFETGIPVEEVQMGLSRMQDAGKIVVDGSVIWLVNFVKHQTTTSPKLVESLKNLVPHVPSPSVKKEICLRYPHLFDECDTLSGGADRVSPPSDNGMTTVRGIGKGIGKGSGNTIAHRLNAERDFEIFWQAYPRKKSKGQAQKTWDKLRKGNALPDMPVILDAIAAAKAGQDWQRDGGKFIPHPGTWLNAMGWEDESVCNVGTSSIFAGAI